MLTNTRSVNRRVWPRGFRLGWGAAEQLQIPRFLFRPPSRSAVFPKRNCIADESFGIEIRFGAKLVEKIADRRMRFENNLRFWFELS